LASYIPVLFSVKLIILFLIIIKTVILTTWFFPIGTILYAITPSNINRSSRFF